MLGADHGHLQGSATLSIMPVVTQMWLARALFKACTASTLWLLANRPARKASTWRQHTMVVLVVVLVLVVLVLVVVLVVLR